MKKILELNSLTYLIIFITVLVLPIAFVAIGSYLIPTLNIIALKTFFTFYGGISLSISAVLSLLLTHFFLKKNFLEKREEINWHYLLKINLIFVIFHLLITIISSLINYFNISNYFVFALYLFYPLIYFCLILFLDYQKISYKEIRITLLIIYLLWYLIIPIISFILRHGIQINNIVMFKSLMYSLLYYFIRFSLLVMPFISLALNKINQNKKEKSIIHSFEFSISKLIIMSLVLLGITLSVIVILR